MAMRLITVVDEVVLDGLPSGAGTAARVACARHDVRRVGHVQPTQPQCPAMPPARSWSWGQLVEDQVRDTQRASTASPALNQAAASRQGIRRRPPKPSEWPIRTRYRHSLLRLDERSFFTRAAVRKAVTCFKLPMNPRWATRAKVAECSSRSTITCTATRPGPIAPGGGASDGSVRSPPGIARQQVRF